MHSRAPTMLSNCCHYAGILSNLTFCVTVPHHSELHKLIQSQGAYDLCCNCACTAYNMAVVRNTRHKPSCVASQWYCCRNCAGRQSRCRNREKTGSTNRPNTDSVQQCVCACTDLSFKLYYHLHIPEYACMQLSVHEQASARLPVQKLA